MKLGIILQSNNLSTVGIAIPEHCVMCLNW